MNDHILEQWGLSVSDAFPDIDLDKYGHKLVSGEGRITSKEFQTVEEAMRYLRRHDTLAAKIILLIYIGLSIKDAADITGYTSKTVRIALYKGEGFVNGYLAAKGIL